MLPLLLGRAEAAPIKLLVLGAHSDDAEIGCGGTVLKLIQDGVVGSVCWVVLSGKDERIDEARVSAEAILAGAPESQILQPGFRDGFFPYDGAGIKAFFEELKDFRPDLILTHQRHDLHQDHRITCELTWNTFRNHFILEYEIPKYDGDLRSPNVFMPLEPRHCEQKVEHLLDCFPTQRDKNWFTRETFMAVMRLRGVECNAAHGYAEGF